MDEKMSKRTILSRPRTRVYDANYNIGESMYRPALNNLDRKYYGRSTYSPQQRSTISSDLLDRHDRAFMDDSLDNCRRRAEKYITGDSYFDSRGARIDARDLMDGGYNGGGYGGYSEEPIRKSRATFKADKAAMLENIDHDDSIAAETPSTRRIIQRTKEIILSEDDDGTTRPSRSRRSRLTQDSDDLDEIGLTSSTSKYKKWSSALKDDSDDLETVTSRPRTSRFRRTELSEDSGSSLRTRKPLKLNDVDDSGASVRAKQTRARLDDLEDEMNEINERAAEREKRAARLKALIAEVAEEADIQLQPTTSSRRAMRLNESQEEEVAY